MLLLSFVKRLFRSFVLFLIRLFFFILLNCRSALYIPDKSCFSDLCFDLTNMFPYLWFAY